MNNKITIVRLVGTFLFSFAFCFAYSQNYHLIIGTYTGTGSKGIYVYNFNSQNGKTSWLNNSDSVSNPSYVTLSPNGKFLYAVNENHGSDPGKVSAFGYNNRTGAITFVNQVLSGGDDPCYVAVSKDDKFVTVANYTSGSMAVFPVNPDGSLQPYSQFIQDSGSSVNKDRQESAHVHETVFTPDNKFLVTPDLGMDQLKIYHWNSGSTNPLSPAAPPYISAVPGSGPRHITFSPNGKFAYLIHELNGTVAVYAYHMGKFKLLQRVATHSKGYKGMLGSAEVQVSPDGKFFYASNRGDQNTITIFRINSNGTLKLVGYQSVMGIMPRNFIIDPGGNYLLVANQESDNIVIFKINKTTGLLKESAPQIHIPKPVCLQLIKVAD
jgi:6-phosphogluconolactonase